MAAKKSSAAAPTSPTRAKSLSPQPGPVQRPTKRLRAAEPAARREDELPGRLQAFVGAWGAYSGTEQAGAQPFLQGLLDIYGATYAPGTIFEQHPVRSVRNAQASLFGGDFGPQYTTERMDMYLPKVCVWEMKGPGEKNLGKHHKQLLDYWARMQTRYMVLCNFREFWIYDTDEDGGQLVV